MYAHEYGHADRHHAPQPSYNTTPRREVHLDSYGHYAHLANPPSPIASEDVDNLASDVDYRLRLPPDSSMEANERRSHRPSAPVRGYESQVGHSLGHSKDKKKAAANRSGQVSLTTIFLDLGLDV